MVDPGDAGDADALAGALRGARPEHEDVAAALTRARVAAALFGAAAPVTIGRYALESKAGAGGGGVVFVARDPELSRRVAIKLMHAGGDRDRMLAEGQALARLSHPNVVPVYDAGALDDQVYVVMELVEGGTLRAFCDEPRRTVREIVGAYRQAGEGLAAAHRAGIIHRDFKPDNALVGGDGRVRVVDFGLARSGEGPVPGAIPSESGADVIVVTRAGLGTLRYMAPEQAAGAPLTPAADQHAFCASLREGLLARADALPRWLDAIVRRGTAPLPADRYPSMDAVLAALARDPAWRWRRRGLAAGVLGVAAAAFVVGRGDSDDGPRCDGAAAELAGAWTPATAPRITAHLAALGTPYAQQASAHVTAALDGYATRWRAGHRDACVAHRDGAQSAALLDRRAACLARAKAALGTAAGIVSSTTSTALADAVAAISELPDLERCGDPVALTSPVAPPAAAIAPAVAQLADRLASLEVEVRAAVPDVRKRIDETVTAARALGYRPLLARALRLSGFGAIAVYLRRAAIAPLTEATNLALTAGDQPLAVEAYARRFYAEGTLAPSATPSGVELIQAMAAGLPESERAVRALLDNNIGAVELAAGRRDAARAAFERALVHARSVRGPWAVELAIVRTNLGTVVADAARRAELVRERIAIVQAALGAGHPRVLAAFISAALLESHRERAWLALAPPCDGMVLLQPSHGSEILECQFELGLLALDDRDLARARRAFEQSIASRPAGGIGTPGVVARAYLRAMQDDRVGAEEQLSAALRRIGPRIATDWWIAITAADVQFARGRLAETAGDRAAAHTAFDAARVLLEPVIAVHDSPHYLRRLARARAALVRVADKTQPLSPELRSSAEAALAWYRAAGGYDDVVAELERSLAR